MKMIFDLFFIIINLIIIFCEGCFPTPPAAPAFPIGDMFECPPSSCSLSGLRVIITETADANCVYTATATCTAMSTAEITVQGLQFNGAGPFYTSPQPLTCDVATGQYLYTDNGGVQQAATSIECVCANAMCSWIFGGCQLQIPDVGGPVLEADDACVYQYEIYCTGAQTMISLYSPPAVLIETRPYPPAVQPTWCPAGKTGSFYFLDLFGVQQTLDRCICS